MDLRVRNKQTFDNKYYYISAVDVKEEALKSL